MSTVEQFMAVQSMITFFAIGNRSRIANNNPSLLATEPMDRFEKRTETIQPSREAPYFGEADPSIES